MKNPGSAPKREENDLETYVYPTNKHLVHHHAQVGAYRLLMGVIVGNCCSHRREFWVSRDEFITPGSFEDRDTFGSRPLCGIVLQELFLILFKHRLGRPCCIMISLYALFYTVYTSVVEGKNRQKCRCLVWFIHGSSSCHSEKSLKNRQLTSHKWGTQNKKRQSPFRI